MWWKTVEISSFSSMCLRKAVVYGLFRPVPAAGVRAGRGGEGDDGPVRAFHLGQAALDAGASRGSDHRLQLIRQWIVATGVEHQDAQVLGLLEIVQDVVHARGAAEVGFVGQRE